jgi:hypothetical protein
MAEAMMGGSAPQPTMEDFAAFEQIRQEVSPSEINETLLATAAEADPMAVAEFKSELRDLDLPPEVLDALDGMVDEILAAPERYAEIRAQYLAQDMSEDLLPEVFDAEFFGALNMALDEIRATSGGPARAPQGFARGGIASLGRNGDTMLAHVTPAEMRMLKANGGAGTINPRTGLPEFFSLKKVFSKIGRAAKKFARSTIGKIVIGTALFFVAGPAATAMFGTTAAPALIAATQGFVAGAGSSLLAGESLRDSLKMGAIGAISAGAFTGVTQGASAFQSTTPVTQVGAGGFELAAGPLNPGAEVAQTAIPSDVGFQSGLPKLDTSPLSTSVDSALRVPVSTVNPVTSALNTPQAGGILSANTSGFTSPLTPAQTYAAPRIDPGLNRSALPGATAPQSGFSLSGSVAPPAGQPAAPLSFTDRVANLGPNGTADTSGIVGLSRNAPPPPPQSLMDKATSLPGKVWDKISPKAIGLRGDEAANEALRVSKSLGEDAFKQRIAYDSAKASVLSKYLPLAAAGVGVMGLAGGFNTEEPQMPDGYGDFMNAPGQRLLDQYPERYGLSFGGVRPMGSSGYQTYTPPPYTAAQGSGPSGVAQGFPRMNGPIDGPGTGTSDDVPAMLSDGEFVFTAKAVRNMGQGSRRKGAKKMYALMKKLEGTA